VQEVLLGLEIMSASRESGRSMCFIGSGFSRNKITDNKPGFSAVCVPTLFVGEPLKRGCRIGYSFSSSYE
jgi:hypothetical protein